MKRKLLFISLLVFTNFSGAFSQEPVIYNVVYEFKYVRDLSQRNNPLITNMVLSLGKQSSRFCSQQLYYDRNPSLQKKENQVQSTAKPSVVTSGGPMLFVGKAGVFINEETIKNRANATTETVGSIVFKTYYVPENLPKIDWSLHEGKKVIGTYNCQKAIGKLAGRSYEVWFTTELPFSDGPFKLNGLPGLILEAQDSTGEILFTFKEISQRTGQNESVASFLKDQFSIKAAQKDYNRSREAFITDPESATMALFPNAIIYINNVDDPSSEGVNKVKKYNPIELN